MNNILDLLGIEDKSEAPPPTPEPPKPKVAQKVAGSIPDAAKAVADAVRADTGRKKKVDTWKKVAGETLGLKRLHPKRWQAVLEYGKGEGLFEIDESGKYPVLVALDPPEPEEEDEDLEVPKEVQVREEPPVSKVSTEPPKDWKPPTVLDCGHMNFASDEKIAEAQAEGKCCTNPKGQIHWRKLKGKYLRPIPEKIRRTREKAEGLGFPGYCCDEKGYYQGGIANCHIYDNPQGTPCEGCGLRRRKREKE